MPSYWKVRIPFAMRCVMRSDAYHFQPSKRLMESPIFDAASASSYARPTTSGRPMPKNPSLTFLSTFGSSSASTSFLSSSSAGRPAKKRSYVNSVLSELSSVSYDGSLGFG